jgi:hypothetical protein
MKVNRQFGGTYHLHLQDRNRSQAQSPDCYMIRACFLLDLFFDPEGGGDMFL